MKPRVLTHSSEIHGMGVFADDHFGPGWFIGTMEGRVTAEPDFHSFHVVWLDDGRGRHYALDPVPPFRFLNHSEEPNAELDGANLYALDRIYAGDEITISYGEDWTAAGDTINVPDRGGEE